MTSTSRTKAGVFRLLPFVEVLWHGHHKRRHLDGHLAANMIYGTIVVLAVIVGLSDHSPGPFQSAILVAVSAATVQATKAYADVIGQEIESGRRLTSAERWTRLRELAVVTAAAEGPVLFLVLAGLGLIQERTAFTLAVWTCVALLFAYGFLARMLGGSSRHAAAMSGGIVAALGVALALLQTLTH